jgi:hypothetical protein
MTRIACFRPSFCAFAAERSTKSVEESAHASLFVCPQTFSAAALFPPHPRNRERLSPSVVSENAVKRNRCPSFDSCPPFCPDFFICRSIRGVGASFGQVSEAPLQLKLLSTDMEDNWQLLMPSKMAQGE